MKIWSREIGVTMSPEAMLDPIIEVSRQAGKVIMKYFEEGTSTNFKADGSPVTAADQEAENIIIPILKDLTPSIPIVAEESAAAGNFPKMHENTFWLESYVFNKIRRDKRY